MNHARNLSVASIICLFVALALVGDGAATHSTLTATLSPKTIEQGVWRNFTVTVRNEGPWPVNISQVSVSFSWTRSGYVVFFDSISPNPIRVGETRSYRLGDLDVSPVPAEGIWNLDVSLQNRHWNFTFDVAFGRSFSPGDASSLELIAGILLVAALVVPLVAIPVAFVLIRSRSDRPLRSEPRPPPR